MPPATAKPSTAAITGLERVSRVGPIGPGPSSGMGRRSPSASALRSAPAQKVPSAPVRMATDWLLVLLELEKGRAAAGRRRGCRPRCAARAG